jgi:uncharacterized protein (TIGR03437 family)
MLFTTFVSPGLSQMRRSAPAETLTCQAPFNVGFRVVTIPSGPKVAIWYPSSSPESPYPYASTFSGSIALNGTPSTCSLFPLVVFSHGLGGCGTQSIFFTEELARDGYVVAAPDHADALCSVDGRAPLGGISSPGNLFAPQSWTDATYANRKIDDEKTIDWMLGSSDFSPQIDPNAIAASGHSLGGYDALGIAGGWRSWIDSRIKAVLALAPYSLPFSIQNTLAGIKVPVMYQGAQGDIFITPFVQGSTGAYGSSNAPKYFMELIGGTHFEWTNLLCAGIPTVSACLEAEPNAQLINSYSLAFFDRYLKRTTNTILKLTGAGVATFSHLSPLATVSAASYAVLPVAPESIVSAFGDLLSDGQSTPTQTPLPTSLGGVQINVTDSQRIGRAAPLFMVSPEQINYLIPAGSAMGAANISVSKAGQSIAIGSVQIANVAPSIFSADESGSGVAAGQAVFVASDGSQTLKFLFDPATGKPIPVNLKEGAVYLSLYGTGMRNNGGGASATIAGQSVPLAGPVPHSIYVGLDQINLGPLPQSLAGVGQADIVILVDGKRANTISVVIQ